MTARLPLLTVVVPAFDAEAHLARALDGLGDIDGLEVIVVDDGSRDATAAVAQGFADAHPRVIRVLSQRNGGHGGAINAGVDAARGRYLRVLDADDWLDLAALRATMAELDRLEGAGGVDALVTDFVYEREGRAQRRVRFGAVFPAGMPFEWEDTEPFGRRQFLMMHALTFRTELVRSSEMRLPEHTFYVDSLFVLGALAGARRLAYLPVPLYRYLIGRQGQSVEAAVMVRRADQQLRVTRLALALLPSPRAVAAGRVPARLHAAMLHYVEGLCAVTSATLARGGTAAHLAERDRFWRELRAENPWVYARMRRTLLGASANLPGAAGRRVTTLAYGVARRVVGFS